MDAAGRRKNVGRGCWDRKGSMRLELTAVVLRQTGKGRDGGSFPVGFDLAVDLEFRTDERSDDAKLERNLMPEARDGRG